jgi:hypothetical protein
MCWLGGVIDDQPQVSKLSLQAVSSQRRSSAAGPILLGLTLAALKLLLHYLSSHPRRHSF